MKRFFFYVSLLPALSLAAYPAFAATGTTTNAAYSVSFLSFKNLRDRADAERAKIDALSAGLNGSVSISRTLSSGSEGDDVKDLQGFLAEYGAYPEARITGHFGPLTKRAVRKFQESQSIDEAGEAGPLTRARIRDMTRQSSANIAPAPEIISAVLSRSIAEDGSAPTSTVSFFTDDPNIFAVIGLKGSRETTEIGYARSYNGSVFDSGVSHPSRAGIAYLHFQWALRPGMRRMPGDYSVLFSIDGRVVRTISYSIH